MHHRRNRPPRQPRQTRLLAELRRALGTPGPERVETGTVVVIGVGSELRSDDAAGIRVAARVSALGRPDVHGLDGGTAPENLTGEIRRLAPSHVIIVDAADMGEPPGSIRLLDPDSAAGSSFGTHGLPLGVLSGYLASETGCRVILIGIQPQRVQLGETLSPPVAASVEQLAAALEACLPPR